jgi:hypothetical protein
LARSTGHGMINDQQRFHSGHSTFLALQDYHCGPNLEGLGQTNCCLSSLQLDRPPVPETGISLPSIESTISILDIGYPAFSVFAGVVA